MCCADARASTLSVGHGSRAVRQPISPPRLPRLKRRVSGFGGLVRPVGVRPSRMIRNRLRCCSFVEPSASSIFLASPSWALGTQPRRAERWRGYWVGNWPTPVSRLCPGSRWGSTQRPTTAQSGRAAAAEMAGPSALSAPVSTSSTPARMHGCGPRSPRPGYCSRSRHSAGGLRRLLSPSATGSSRSWAPSSSSSNRMQRVVRSSPSTGRWNEVGECLPCRGVRSVWRPGARTTCCAGRTTRVWRCPASERMTCCRCSISIGRALRSTTTPGPNPRSKARRFWR